MRSAVKQAGQLWQRGDDAWWAQTLALLENTVFSFSLSLFFSFSLYSL
jgi:hypothetical protein